MSSDSLKLEKHLCRCCHAEGCFKTLGVSFDAESSGVVYSDMIRDYLDINLTPVAGPLCLVTYTICEECVSRLHDCVSFKKQVLACEERFRDMYRRDLIKVQNPDLAANIKLEIDIQDIPSTYVEALKVECPKQDVEDFAQESDFDYQDDIDLDELPNQDDSTKINLEMSEDNLTKVEDLKKKEKGKGKAKATKTTKKVAKPKKSALSEPGEKKAKKDRDIPLECIDYSIIEDGSSKKYICLKCQTIMIDLPTLKHHIMCRHTIKNNPIKCPICDKELSRRSKFKEHLLSIHGMEEVLDGNERTFQASNKIKYICNECKRDFFSRKSLYTHICSWHVLNKCPDCNLRFNKKQMAFHRNEAHGQVIPTCGVCGYKNRDVARLTLHQRRVHLLEKNFDCDLCSMSFFDVKGLRRHQVKHGSDKEFKCSYCSKKFPRQTTLWMHEKIHKGEKNKVCTVCDQRFVQKASLNYHMARHHPGVSF